MKMNVTATVSHALGHWPRILPAAGDSGAEEPSSALSGLWRE
ncbi:hypothetical protein A1YU_04034 [Escherichia coli KTE142]|nr:hypothetical protein A1YU_04034 [Escherichia coli KTE142]